MTRYDTTRREWLRLAAAASACAGIWPLASSVRAATKSPPLVVIVSAKFDTDSISEADLRRCFLGRKVKIAGKSLVPFNHPHDSALRKHFDEKILHMSPVESQRYWINSMIRGGPRPPRKINSPALLAKVIAKLPGAISYLDPDTAQKSPGLRALAIDGIPPEDDDYPLR